MGRYGVVAAMSMAIISVLIFPRDVRNLSDMPKVEAAEPIVIRDVKTVHEELEKAEYSCHEMVMSYIEEDNAPFLVDTTAYYHGTVCSHGDIPREGIVAAAPEWWGMACVMYEAVPTDDGYEMGGLIGIYEIRDTGYGKSSGDGIPSKIRKDKSSRGTIETGKCIDRYCTNLQDAKKWMEFTGGKIFIQIIPAQG